MSARFFLYRRLSWFLTAATIVLVSACTENIDPGTDEANKNEVTNYSVYVDVADNVRLAVDIWLPENADQLGTMPTAIEFTRYWRAMETLPASNNMNDEIRQALDHGFAYVAVDVRGTGASFGYRGAEFSLAEVRDMPVVIDWVAEQAWSNGEVVAVGVSYSGNTAELSALFHSDALVAAIPRFTDYDWYTSIVIPGGLKNAFIAERWGDGTRMLDLNDASVFGVHEGVISIENPKIIGVKPVDNDPARKQLVKASSAHKDNRSLAENLAGLVYRDEYPSALSLEDAFGKGVSIHNFQSEYEAIAMPMYQWGSWFDAGTAAGILARFTRFDAPYQYVIGPWSHGAGYDANPYNEKDSPVEPTANEQADLIYAFARQAMLGKSGFPVKQLRYFTVGENAWKTTVVWPPQGHKYSRMWLGAENTLVDEIKSALQEVDLYQVNFSAGTGSFSRWATQLGGGDVWYGDRSGADEKLLTYTSAPLEHDTELSGTPVVSFHLSTNREDAAVIVYLEDVDENGYVRMLTEGQLRLVHGLAVEAPDPVFGPVRSFKSKHGKKLKPGVVEKYEFALLPLSARIARGHSLRIAIAGHDSDTFVRVPAEGGVEFSIYRGTATPSFIDLPVMDAR